MQPHDEPPQLELTREELVSPLWRNKLQPWLVARIQFLREQNDKDTNDIKATTMLRGEIRFAKRMLALADEAGPTSRQDEDDGVSDLHSSRLKGG